MSDHENTGATAPASAATLARSLRSRHVQLIAIGGTIGAAVLPRATNSVIYRILIFYVGALIVILSLVPWNQLSPTISPFVLVFSKIGVPGAAHIINAVVITAAASSCNSGLYCTGRMLYALSLRMQAPARFGVLNRAHVPSTAVNVSAAAMLIGVALNYLVPEDVFTWVTSIALVGALWTWVMIMLAHRNYRIRVGQGRAAAVSYRMPGAPMANWLVIVFLIAVGAMLWLTPATRVALYVAPAWFVLLAIAYFIRGGPQREAQTAHVSRLR